jgi:hypothetical protein
LSVFILAGEAFSGVEATEFRQRLKTVCESYVASFHRQNIHVRITLLLFLLLWFIETRFWAILFPFVGVLIAIF